MANNLSFNTSGSVDNYDFSPWKFNPPTNAGILNPTNQSTPSFSGLVKSAPASTPVASHSVGADGSTTVTYHKPVTPKNPTKTSPTTPPSPDPTQGGLLKIMPTAPAGQTYDMNGNLVTPSTLPTPPIPTTPQPAGTTPINPTYSGLIGAATDVQNKLAQMRQDEQTTLGDINNGGAPLQFKQGVGQVQQGIYAAKENALANQAQGLNTEAGLVAPVSVSPGNALVTPTTGGEIYSGIGGLTGLGIANQNISQGKAYQQQASDLSTTLSQIDTLTPTLTNFLKTSGLNQEGTPYYNQSIKAYMANVKDPAAAVSLNTMLADLKTYTAQVLGASGLNPTDVASTVASFDPSNLNAEQMTAFITNLRNLGQIRLKPLQDSAVASYSSGESPYLGTNANPSTDTATTPSNESPATQAVGDNPILQGLIGGGINTIGGIQNIISGFASRLGL